MTVSVKQTVNTITIPSDLKAMSALLVAVQLDLAALRTQLNTHTHATNGSASSTSAAELNLTA